MTETFDISQFELVFRVVKDEDREDLRKRLYKEWKRQWRDYLNSKFKKPQQRFESGRKDHHGVETRRFLEWILTKEGSAYNDEALVFIFLTSRMRTALKKAIRKREYAMGLWWLIEEWEAQVDDLKHFDSLTAALIDCDYHPMHIAWAINCHARRMRVGAGRSESISLNPSEKVGISNQLLDLADIHIIRGQSEGGVDQFCAIPASQEAFSAYLHGQRMLNESRDGSQKKAKEMAKTQRLLIRKAEKNNPVSSGFEWPSFLLWWTWYVEIRAASSSMDRTKWKVARKALDELEDEMDSSLKKYFIVRQGDRMKLDIKKDFVKTDAPLRLLLFEVVRRWRDFDLLDDDWSDDSTEYRRFCWHKRGGSVLGFPEMHEAILGPKWKYRHPFAPFQQFVTSRPTDAQTRANKMLKEIERVRAFEPQFSGDLSCLIMELLFRELLYRLWYEVRKMRKGSAHGVDLEFAADVLERIKDDIVRLRAFNKKGHLAIDRTINILRNNRETADEFATTLRKLLNDQRLFKTTRKRVKGKQCYFLGIPYAHDGDDFSVVMHSFSHILEKKKPEYGDD